VIENINKTSKRRILFLNIFFISIYQSQLAQEKFPYKSYVSYQPGSFSFVFKKLKLRKACQKRTKQNQNTESFICVANFQRWIKSSLGVAQAEFVKELHAVNDIWQLNMMSVLRALS
jgi:hypothetical protein